MFGKNEIVGKRFFDGQENLFVTSTFYTLQGEGPFRGHPAFFIRLAKCNLACSFCDTYFDNGDWMTDVQLEENIEQVLNNYFGSEGARPEYTRWYEDEQVYDPREMVLVITGGEPMLQKNLGKFLEKQSKKFQFMQIESNGLVYQDIPDDVVLVVSPKCSEKGGQPVKYLNPNQKVLERVDCLKFVMEADPDSPYSDIPVWAREWHKDTGGDVFVSPMNIYNKEPERALIAKNFDNLETRSGDGEVISFWTPGLLDLEAVRRNHEYTARFCVENGYIFNMQLHLFAGLA